MSATLPSTPLPSTPTRPSTRSLGFWVKIAGSLCVMSLGLPWIITNGTSSNLIPGYFVPGFCRTVVGYDGWSSMECDPGFVGAPIFLPGTTGSTGAGAETTGRFGIVAALASMLFTMRTGNRKLLGYGGLGLLWTAALSTGTGGMTSGVLVAWMASGILLWQGFTSLRNYRMENVEITRSRANTSASVMATDKMSVT